MALVDASAELDHGAVAYVRNRDLRIVTRCELLISQIHHDFVVNRTVKKGRRRETETTEMYDVQRREFGYEFTCPSGLLPMLVRMCAAIRINLRVVDVPREVVLKNGLMMPPTKLYGLEDIWDELRGWQKEVIPLLRYYRFGRFGVGTGAGKSTLLAMYSKLARDSRICITTGNVPDLQNLHRAVLTQGIDAQMITGTTTKRKPTARVVCCTTGSLHRLEGVQFDIGFGDEIHEHAGESLKNKLWHLQSERMFGFSANQNQRADRADMWIEGYYGPLVYTRSYQESVSGGEVAPMRVRFITTGCSSMTSSNADHVRTRVYVVQNEVRNKQIAEVARHYAEQGNQVLVLVSTTEHVLQIRKYLPEAIGVFKRAKPERWRALTARGLTRPGEEPGFTPKQLIDAEAKFKSQQYKVAIANSVWHKGKDFPDLNVVVRGDAISTAIFNTQLNRASRVGSGKKQYGLIVDCWDSFEHAMENRSRKRRAFYRKQGWEIISNEG